ncbi:hypothetical protein HG531_006074 [Fusarium graminearum]|nr:hypothetical protein HG531_006074 [Fusarium graminearum]
MLLQCSFLLDLLICLDLIVDLEVLKAFKTDTALTTLAHLHDILFDIRESLLDVVNNVVDNAVVNDANASFVRTLTDMWQDRDVEIDNDALGGSSVVDVVLRNSTDARSQEFGLNFIAAQLLNGATHSLHGTSDISLDNEILKDDARLSCDRLHFDTLLFCCCCGFLCGSLLTLALFLFSKLLGTLLSLGHFLTILNCCLGFALVRCLEDHFTSIRELTPAKNLNRSSGWCLSDIDASFNPALSHAICLSTDIKNLGQCDDALLEVFHTLTGLSTDRNDLHFTAIVFDFHTVASKISLDLVNSGVFLIDLIDRDDDGNLGARGVFQRLKGLWHNTVIRSNNQHHDICDIGTSLTHRQKRSVSRRVEESDLATGRHLNNKGTDMLRDATMLLSSNRRLS